MESGIRPSPFFRTSFFSRGTLPTKKWGEKGHLAGGNVVKAPETQDRTAALLVHVWMPIWTMLVRSEVSLRTFLLRHLPQARASRGPSFGKVLISASIVEVCRPVNSQVPPSGKATATESRQSLWDGMDTPGFVWIPLSLELFSYIPEFP